MPEAYAGTVVELGGEELGASGHPKPRKVVVKADPTAQYGKTFRVWQDSDAWERLSKLNGQHVTVLFDVEERPGGPKGTYTQNMIVGVDAPDSVDGAGIAPPGDSSDHTSPAAAGTPASSTDHSGWGAPASTTWGQPTDLYKGRDVQTVSDPTTKTTNKDDYWERREAKDEERSSHMAAAWAISQAIALGHRDGEAIESWAHQLLVLKERIVSELSS